MGSSEAEKVGGSQRHREDSNAKLSDEENTIQPNGKKPGRNEPCACGSGKKYKKCCGR